MLKLSVLGSTSGCAVLCFKTGRQEVPGSIPACACRPCRSEFSVDFSESRVNTGWNPLERPPTEGSSLRGPGPSSRQLALILQPTNQPTILT